MGSYSNFFPNPVYGFYLVGPYPNSEGQVEPCSDKAPQGLGSCNELEIFISKMENELLLLLFNQ